MTATTRSAPSVCFVDSSLDDLPRLLSLLPEEVEVVSISPELDGLAQMLAALEGRGGLEAIHIVSHGASGRLDLGASQITAATLEARADDLARLGSALSEDGNLLVYGCNVAEGDAGLAFVQRLAALTGADVAASEDLTGAAARGGDWDLEVRAGEVETAPLGAAALAAYDGTLALPGAHSGVSGGQVFIGGNYIELGISAVGSFGTTVSKPAGFYGTSGSSAVGMSNDADGFGNGADLAIDYFLPGSPEERWSVGYNGSVSGGYSALNGPVGATLSGTSLTNNSSGDNLSAKFTGTVNSALKVEQVHSFKVNDKFFKTTVTLTNTSGSTMTDVRFMRSFDPDNTVYKGGNFDTVNRIESTIADGGKAVVSATSKPDSYSAAAGSTAKILFFSSDSRAYVANFGFSNSNPYDAPVQARNYSTTSDSGIAIVFKAGNLAAGASTTFEYYTSLDTADIATTVAAIEAVANPAPTFTAFAAPVESTTEDPGAPVEITFAELAAQGNEADQKPNASGGLEAGTVEAFVVTGVSSGTLRIGADAASATAWSPGANDVIGAGKNAYWTPAANANGTIGAFKVVARDTDGLKSSTPVEAQVTVSAVNDAPVIASAATAVTLAAIDEDQSPVNGATLASLLAPRFTDVDAGATLGGAIVVGDSSTAGQGKWQYSTDNGASWHDIGAVSSTSGLALSAATKLRFAPEADWHGTPGGLAVHLADNAYAGGYTSGATRAVVPSLAASGVSTNSVALATAVNSVNDLPVFTSAQGGATLTETSAYDDALATGKVTVGSGSLTGTLAGTDVEGAVSFTIRGGATSGTTVTKAGFYGTLTLDTSSNTWSYAPTNFAAINALAAGATATETFEFKVIDGDGASAMQLLTITLAGTNDVPVLSAAIADQQFNGQGTWSYQLPADAFRDAEGLDLAYTVQVIDGSGTVVDTIGASLSGISGKPSDWLIFNEDSRTLSGTPTPTQLGQLPLKFRVTATDSAGDPVGDEFELSLNPGASNANPAAPNVAPTTTDDHRATTGTGPVPLAIGDFGSYGDANGDSLSSVKIVTPPSGVNGTLKLNGVTITVPNTVVAAADIIDGKLTFEPGTAHAAITFQVGDSEAAFSGNHTLTIDVGSATPGIVFDASDVSTARANHWTSVYGNNDEVLSGFDVSDPVRVVVEATGGNVRLADASGVTAATGYGNPTISAASIAFEGSRDAVNAALKQLQANLATNPNMTLAISASKGGSAYNPENQHYYQYVESPGITWTDAKTAAAAATFNGLNGYLATITSAAENAFIVGKVGGNAWIGATDAVAEGTSEGNWKWVGGPEAGQVFFNDTDTNDGTTGTTPWFYSWQSGEPNNAGTTEHYAQIITVNRGALVSGKWNDLENTGGANEYEVTGYVIEYGGSYMGGGAVAQQASRTITLTLIDPAPAVAVAGDANYTENATAKALAPVLSITDIDSTALASATVKIAAGLVAGDVLGFVQGAAYGNIQAAYDAGTGTLTLQSPDASATLTQWQAALQSVTFSSTSDAPGASRTIQWQVTDPDGNVSNVGTTNIAVAEVNDAPRATPLPDVTATVGSAIDLSVGSTFTDPEGQAITYSAQYQDTDGSWKAVPASGPSFWLTFDPATRKFAGNPPAGTPFLNLKVIGTDASGDAASSSFKLNLATAAAGAAAENNGGTVSVADINGGAIALGDTLRAAAPVDQDGYAPAGVRYQWQRGTTNPDSSVTWSDIGGASSADYVVTVADSGKKLRVQEFYTDGGGFAEAPVSTELAVPKLDVAGTATVSGSLVPGQTLVATLQDGNGLARANPTYTWYRSSTPGNTVDLANDTVVGGDYSAYTLTNDDGGKYVKVRVTYADDEGTAEVAIDSSDTTIQLGAVAPVAVDDNGTATEAGGVANGTAGTNATGNLFANDTDANAGDTRTLTALHAGDIEGLGTPGLHEGTEYVVAGDYGTLRVNETTGAYTYTVNQSAYAVQALRAGQHLDDHFNYAVTDTTGLSDTAKLTVRIDGANDAPTARDLPTAFAVYEDARTALAFPVPFAIEDADSSGTFTVKLVASTGKLSGASSGGVTVAGNDSGTLTLTGTASSINAWLKAGTNAFYTGAPNVNGAAAATIALRANDGDGSGEVTLATVNVDIAAVNDAPLLDLNLDDSRDGAVPAGSAGLATGDHHVTVFRPRGEAVRVVDDDVRITDAADGDTMLSGARVKITAGDLDNVFTTYETLYSSAGGSFVSGGQTITITGNGSGTGGLTGATELTLSGAASHAAYEAALRTIYYSNANDSAFAGNRAITVSVRDAAGAASNAGSFTTTAANAAIAVGQKILLGGVDTGQTVAAVIDSRHFVASGPLPALADGSALQFWLDGAQVTSATASAPLAADGFAASAATTTVLVRWTPVVDLNGSGGAGTAHATSYTEGATGAFVARPDAQITDQDGNLKEVKVTLTNPADTSGGTSTESLFIAGSLMSTLAANGITTTVAPDGHSITFTGNKDATFFQLGLRGVQYRNTSENPSVTPRVVTTTLVDQDDNTGVAASTTISIVPVNDAPVPGGDRAATLSEGGLYVFGTADLDGTDVDDAAGTLKFVLTSPAGRGTLFRDANNNNLVDAGEQLVHTADTGTLARINEVGTSGYFTRAEVAAGRIKYLHDGANPDGTHPSGTDSFSFKLVDGMEDYPFADIAAHQAGTVTLTVNEVNDAPTGAVAVSGTVRQGQVLTADAGTVADADGPASPVLAYRWQQSADGSTWADIAGANAATYTLAAGDVGRHVRAVASYTDALGRVESVASAASAAVIASNRAPIGTVTIDGSPAVGQVLAADTSAVGDADGLGPFAYQWEVSTDGGATWAPIAGATGRTYTLTEAQDGHQVRVAVAWHDGLGSDEQLASGGVTASAAPEINDAPYLSATGRAPAAADGTQPLFDAVSVGTVEAGQAITRIVLAVSGLRDGADEKLVIDGVTIDLAATGGVESLVYPSLAPAGTVGGVSYEITMAGTTPDTATVEITHAGLGAAQAQALVQALAFSNTAASPTTGLRVVTLASLTDDGGTAGGGHDTADIGVSATVDVGGSLPGSNTAPTVDAGADRAATVGEGGVVALTTADLAAGDAEQAGLAVTVSAAPAHGQLFRDLDGDGSVDAGAALGAGSRFALAEIANGRIKYRHDGSETGSDGFGFTVGDGLASSDADPGTPGDQPHSFAITVTPADDAPTLSASAGNPTFAEGAAPAAPFAGADVSAVDAGQSLTSLTIVVSGLRDGAAEKLLVDGTSIALVHDVTARTTTGGAAVGYTVSVTGGTATVTLTKTAGGAAWSGLVDGLRYQNTSDNPTAGERAVTLAALTDDGATANAAAPALTSRVAVSPVNDAPTLVANGITVGEGGSRTLTDADLVAADVDSPLSGLLYTVAAAPTRGALYIDFDGNGVRNAGETLAAGGHFSQAQLASGKVRYEHDGSESADSFGVTLGDGGGAGSVASATMAVAITHANDVPAIAGLGSDVMNYPASSGAQLVEQGGNASVSDPDSANFAGGSLRVSISFNRDPAHDVLSVRDIGTGPGQIGVAGGNVTYGGAVIGTLSGGTGTDDLVVSLNAGATPEAVGALVRAVQFANDQANPAATSRTIGFALNDGAADGQAAPVSVNVNLQTGVTPSISIGNGFFVMENTTLVTALSAVDPSGRPVTFSVSAAGGASNQDKALFTVGAGNLLRFATAPDYESPSDAGADRVYKVVVRATNDLGAYAEQALTINLLDQADERAAVGDTDAPAFGYATVDGTMLRLFYNDASPLETTGAPVAGQFTVRVGGTAVAVDAVAVDADARAVTLTLASPVAAGQAVTVSYADANPADGVVLQDAAGNDAAALTDAAVANLAGGGGGGGGGSGDPTPPTRPNPGTITGGSSTTSTDGDGSRTTTTTGTIGTVTVVEKVVVTTEGTTQRELVYVPAPAGEGAGGTSRPVELPLLYEEVPGSDSNTTLTLPAGVGLSSIGARTPTGESAEQDLIRLIQATVDDRDPAKGGMLDGGRSFLDQRPEGSTLWVNKIVLTATEALAAPATPVVVSGAANNASSTYTGDKLEALVIDAGELPAGSTVELQNVDFAVVVGDGITVRGGAGANVVYGGAGAQDIMLGSDDDVLYGGAGNDRVGSADGADRIFGNAGNDTVFGGAGSDLLHGGADVDVASYAGSIRRYDISRDHGKTIVRSLDRLDDIDTLVNVESIRFDDATYTVGNDESLSWIATLYKQALGRQADLAGFQYWAEGYASGDSIGSIAMSFLLSSEFAARKGAFSSLGVGEQIDLMYAAFLGREADAPGHAYWVDRAHEGMSLEKIAESFVRSPEMEGLSLRPEGWEFMV